MTGRAVHTTTHVIAALNVILSLALIPPFGASGAALSAAISGATLALFGVLQTRSAFGGITGSARLLSVPTAGGIAMTAAIVLVPGGLFVQITVGLATFAAVAAGVLRRVAPDALARRSRQGPSDAELTAKGIERPALILAYHVLGVVPQSPGPREPHRRTRRSSNGRYAPLSAVAIGSQPLASTRTSSGIDKKSESFAS